MKRTKEELLNSVREHGGETPDEYTISLLEDIADSFLDEAVDNSEELAALQEANKTLTEARDALQVAYDTLKKSYADRFTLQEEDVKTEDEKEEEEAEAVETYDSIFE